MNPKKEFTEEEKLEIQQYYDQNPNIKKVAQYFHISYHVLRRFIKFKHRTKTKRKRDTETYRNNIKRQLVDYKGGRCSICGYDKYIGALEFHHLNPNKKDFGISGGTKSFETLRPEVDKCILVCSNCHREIHTNVIKIN